MHNDSQNRLLKSQPKNDLATDLAPKTGKMRSHYKRLLYAVIISVSIHIIALWGFLWIIPTTQVNKRTAALQVWLQPKSSPINKIEKKQVVELAAINNQHRPKEAQYLAEHDNSAEKETKARLTTSVRKTKGSPSANDTTHVAEDQIIDQKDTELNDSKTLAKEHFFKTPKSKKNNDPLGIRPMFDDTAQPESGASAEHLPLVKEGEKTELNAWQWQHAPFFNRIKTRIGGIWSPQMKIARYDPRGTLLGNKDRVTILSVTIDREGALKDLTIADTSGVAYLDEEAERALKEAAPFVFPPKELFNEKGEFSFTFAFHLQLNRGFSFDFDWDKN